ncbi:CHASE3 domain-containing protein [Rhizobium sp. KVB221]|uniref:histidine kinase n=1 Tax=Rhizobium setariae TaxID=2801340 RepID=A0A936YJA9_9HYPH|nr:ATP-binding protein [Rhizobium setariae]MBL0370638.1 CHASE3 domain-containing protein [Rhizobium setariae]
MPARKKSLIRSTSIALLSSGVVLVGIVASMVYLVYRTQDFVSGAVEARTVRSAAADLLLAVQDAETGQRGFLLTQEDAFLTPYLESIGKLEEREAEFDRALSQSDFIAVDPELIKQTINSKIAELRQTLALAQANRRNEAMEVLRSEYGLRLMADIRAELSGIIEASDARIESQLTTQVELATLLRLATVVGAILIVCIMIAVIAVMRRYVLEILAARVELEGLNASLEERVRERTQDVLAANQEIQRYTYIVTHDLRAPLVNIMGFTSELDAALKAISTYFNTADNLDPQAKEAAEHAVSEDLPEAIGFIRSSTSKMDALISAILKISRDGRRDLKPETIDLESLINSATQTIRHQVSDANGEIEISIGVRQIVSDRFSIEQVIANLLDNAAKYKEPSRPLRLSIRTYVVNRLTVGIEVADNGRGISDGDRERVFELFRRAGVQDSPGEGIGLAHVRSLLRNMGGDIELRSEIGKGTTFMIRLPLNLDAVLRSARP